MDDKCIQTDVQEYSDYTAELRNDLIEGAPKIIIKINEYFHKTNNLIQSSDILIKMLDMCNDMSIFKKINSVPSIDLCLLTSFLERKDQNDIHEINIILLVYLEYVCNLLFVKITKLMSEKNSIKKSRDILSLRCVCLREKFDRENTRFNEEIKNIKKDANRRMKDLRDEFIEKEKNIIDDMNIKLLHIQTGYEQKINGLMNEITLHKQKIIRRSHPKPKYIIKHKIKKFRIII